MPKKPTLKSTGRSKAKARARAVAEPSGEDYILEAFDSATPPPADPAADEPLPARGRRRAEPFRHTDAGVERRVERTDPVTNRVRVQWRWFCSPLRVTAITRNADGDDFGKVLEFTDLDGVQREWAMPSAMLSADGNAYRERLLSQGVDIAHGREARADLHNYLTSAKPTARARCVGRLGWHSTTFVGTDVSYESEPSPERFILQSAAVVDHAYRKSGTLDGWQDEVAKYAVGNSRLALAVSAAFAGPLLKPTDTEGGGFHLRGGSSTGKTTALIAAGSVWGGGGIRGFIRTWRATANGIESIAGLHCDALLCLDELGQVDGAEAGQVAYMLANGQGKTRANKFGEARPAAEWRTLFLSTGEMDLATKIAEEGRGRRIAAGQEVRVVDIPADAGRGLGLFESLYGFPSADALARHLKLAAERHYGHAAPAFLELAVKDYDGIGRAVAEARTGFLEANLPAGADGQVSRVASRFALIAAAGEMATAFGILPWPRGEATRAAASCFAAWLDGRGGVEAAEVREAIAAVRRCIEAHGHSRFEPIGTLIPRDSFGNNRDGRIFNRVGYRRESDTGRIEYLILPEQWKSVVCDGLDAKAVARILANRGLLATDAEGTTSRMCNLPGHGWRRCYIVSEEILGGGEPAAPTDDPEAF